MDWDTFALGTDTSGKSGRRRCGAVRASSTTAREERRTANSTAVAVPDTRPAAAAIVAAAAGGPVGVGPVGRRAWCRLPTSVVGAVPVTRAARGAVRAAGRNTRDGSTWAGHRSVERMAGPRAAVYDETVCDGTASSGCGESSRAGGAGRRDTRTGSAAPADSGGPVPGALGVAAEAPDTGDWPKREATGSTTAATTDGTGPGSDNRGTRAVSGLTSI